MNHIFIAGFDFGTSYSKVVIRDLMSDLYKFVTFGPERTGLLPSFVRAGTKFIRGPFAERRGKQAAYLKLLAADHVLGTSHFAPLHGETSADNRTVRHLVTGYFCSVLDGIRSFVQNDPEWSDYDPHGDLFGVQLAVPTGLIGDKDRALEEFLRSALMVAMLIWDEDGCRGGEVSRTAMDSALDQLHGLSPYGKENLQRRCIVYPEVAAGVQAVFRMRSGAPTGKYITMDVGAGTVDLNAFVRLHPSGGRSGRLNYWACEVAPLGASRLSTLHPRACDHEKVDTTLDSQTLKTKLGEAVTGLMIQAFNHQPTSTVGDGGNPWTRNTYAYIFGGGAHHRSYRTVIERKLRELGVSVDAVLSIPVPSDCPRTPRGVSFGRWAVAFGLSFPVQNLEEIRLPRQLQTFEQAHPEIWQQLARDSGLPQRPVAEIPVTNRPPEGGLTEYPARCGTCPLCGKNVPHVRNHIDLKACPVLLSRLPVRRGVSRPVIAPRAGRIVTEHGYQCPECSDSRIDLDAFIKHVRRKHRDKARSIEKLLNNELSGK
jgi:hypothetical protein